MATYNGTNGDDVINASAGNNTINAGNGNNRVTATGTGKQKVTAGTGNDTITTGEGDDTINAGAGNNVINAGGGRNDVTTLGGNDTITSGSGDDDIDAGDGRNIIDAGNGANSVRTGSGDDQIKTGSGNDQISAGEGHNLINAGDGTNTVNAGAGNDTITTGSGNDQISAGNGNNVINAGAGNNNVNAGTGDDWIRTGAGNDTISVGDGNNDIDAGNGTNTVNTGRGDDIIVTGSGKDTINAGDGRNEIDAGAGDNRVNTGRGDDDITTGNDDDTINAGDGLNVIHAGDGDNAITSGSGADTITAGSGNDDIHAGEGHNVVNAGDGHNHVTAGSGNDRITTGSGNDAIYAGEGSNIVDAGDGINLIYTGSGNDRVIGGSGNDLVYTGGGDDFVDLGGGSDVVYLDGGNDTYRYVMSQHTNTIDVAWGGSGTDTLQLVLTADQARDARVLSDIQRFNTDSDGSGLWGWIFGFQFTAFNLSVRDFENIDVIAPVDAVNDSATVGEDSQVTVNVLANDLDLGEANNSQLRVVSYDAAGVPGTLTLVDNRFTFVPGAAHQSLAAGQSTTVSFTYTIADNEGFTDTATVTLTIVGSNDGPVAVADVAAITENQAVTVDVLANDTDVDNRAVLTLVSAGAPAGKGLATVIDNKLAFAPGTAFDHLAAGATESVLVTYTMVDEHGATSTSTLTITVTGTNDGPVAVADLAATAENQSLTVDVLANDTDLDDGALFTLTAATVPAGKGAASIVDNKLVFTPGADFDYLAAGATETVIVGYAMADEHGATSTSTLRITITGTNDVPVAVADLAAATEDGTVVSGSLAGNDSDVDQGATLSFALDAPVAGLTLAADGSYSFDPAAGAYQSLAAGEQREVVAHYTVTDDQGATAQSTLTITLTGTNDAPVVTSTTGDAAGTVREAGATDAGTPAAAGQLASSDVDNGATATWTGSAAGVYGSFAITAAGAWAYTLDNARGSTDALAAGETATETFLATVTDDQGATATQIVTITITGTNDAPVALADVAAGTENQVLAIDVLGNDSDVDHGAVLTLVSVAAPAGKGVAAIAGNGLVFTPGSDFDHLAAGATELVTLTYTMTDEHGVASNSTVTVTVTGTNDGPVAVADVAATTENAAITVDVLANDTDADDGHVFTLTAATAPAGKGIAAVAGNRLVFTPGSDFDHLAVGATEVVTVSYAMIDEHGAESVSTLTITITGTNDAPVAVADVASGTENQTLTIDVLANDSDVDDGHVLTLASVSAPEGKGLAAVVNNRVVFAPGGDFDHLPAGVTETVTLSYEMKDEFGATSASTVTITVTGTNDAPVAGFDEAGTTENASITIDVLANDTDKDDGHVLAVTGALVQPGQGSVAVVANSLVFTPGSDFDHLAAGDTATVVVFYSIKDDKGAQSAATVTITVTGTNDAPIAVADTGATTENAAVTIDVLANDTDLDDGHAFTLTAAAAPSGKGAAAVVGNSLVFTPGSDFDHLAAGAVEVVTLSYTMHDDQGASSTSTVSVTITGTNDAPLVTSDAAAASGGVVEAGNLDNGAAVGGTPSTGGQLSASDADDNAVLAWGGSASGTYGSFAIGVDGAWTYALDNASTATQALREGETVTETFTATVTDQFGASATQIVTVTVAGTNDSPVITSGAAAATGTVIEAGNLDDGTAVAGISVATGTLTSSDVDAGAAASWSGNASGTYGSFAIDASTGLWTYTLGNTLAATQGLNEGQTVTESFTATVTDDFGAISTQVVMVNVTGTNDGPVAVADTGGSLSGGTTITFDNEASGNVVLGTYQNNGYQFSTAHAHVLDTNGWPQNGTPRALLNDGGSPITMTKVGGGAFNLSSFQLAEYSFGFTSSSFTLTGTRSDGTTVTQTITIDGIADGVGGQDDYQLVTPIGFTDLVSLTFGANGEIFNLDTIVLDASAGLTTAENAALTIDVLANDTDVDSGAVLAISGATTPAGQGSVAVVDGRLLFTPGTDFDYLAVGQQATVTIGYTITDQFGATSSSTATVIVTGTNDAPVAVADSNAVTEDSIVSGSVAPNDSDVDSGAVLSYTLNAPVAGLTLSSNGSYSFNAANAAYQNLAQGETRVVTANYTVTDNLGLTAVASLTITVTGTNDAPVAVADTGSVFEDATISGNVRTNDVDVDAGAVLTYALNGPVAGLTLNANGTYSFTAANPAYQALALNEVQVVTAGYTVTDQFGATSQSTLTITVTGRNDAPVAVVDTATAIEDGAIVTGNVGANDSDVDHGAVLTYAATNTVAGLTINSNGSYSFDPSNAAYQNLGAGATRTVTGTYRVTDQNGASATSSLNITVTGTNDAPVVGNVTLLANRLGNGGFDSTPAFAGWTVSTGSTGTTGSFTSTATIDRTGNVIPGDNAVAVLNYSATTPVGYGTGYGPKITSNAFAGNAGDTVSFTYKLSSGGDQAIGTAYIRDAVTGAIVQTIFNYQVPFVGTTGVQTVNLVLATSGTYTIDFQLGSYDATGGRAIGARLDIGFAGILANGISENEPFTFSNGRSLLLANSTDVDVGDTLTVAPFVTTSLLGAAVTLAADGTLVVDPRGSLQIQALKQGESATDSFTFSVSDGKGGITTGTASITMTGANDAPVANADTASTTENQTLTVNALANDTDVDHDAVLTLVSAGVTPGKGTVAVAGNQIVFTPGAAFDHLSAGATETVVVTYVMRDEFGATSTSAATITVIGTNDAPIAVADTAAGTENQVLTVDVLANDTDLDDGHSFTLTAVAAPAGKGSAAIMGNSLVFTPGTDFDHLAAGATEVVVVSYTMTDEHGAESVSTATITITGTNDAPVAVADSGVATEDTVVSGSVATNDSDVDGGAVLTYSLDAPVSGLTLNSDGTYSFDAGNTAYQSLAQGQTQSVVANYTVADGAGLSAASTLTITVTGTNDGPVAVADTASATEDAVAITGSVAGNDSDADAGAALTYALDTPIAGLTLNADGTYSFDPANGAYQALGAGETQSVVASYTVTDEFGATAASTLTITVTGTNDAPVAVADTAAVVVGITKSIAVLANDTDVDGDTLSLLSTTAATKGTVTIVGDQINYTANAGASGTDSFTYTAKDAQGATSTATVTVTLDRAPVAVADTYTINAGATAKLNVTTNDTDPDNDAITLTGAGTPSHGTVVVNADNTLSYTPTAGYTGTDSFTYTISDGKGGTATGTVNLTVKVPETAVAPTLVVGSNTVLVPTEGAAMKTTLTLQAGDVVTFDWNFTTDDYAPYKDFAFATVNSQTYSLSNTQATGDYGASGWNTFTFTAQTAGTYVLGQGVMNDQDTSVESYLAVDAIRINGAIVQSFETGFGTTLTMGQVSRVTSGANTHVPVTRMNPTHGSYEAFLVSQPSTGANLESFLGLTAGSLANVAKSIGKEYQPIIVPIGVKIPANAHPDETYVTISGAPLGSVFNHGVYNPANNTWKVDIADLGGNLTITTPSDYAGSFTLSVVATSKVYGSNTTASSAAQSQVVNVAAASVEVYAPAAGGATKGGTLADVLHAGAGVDMLTGGAGNDVFVFKQGTANGDSIVDFVGNGASPGDSLRFEGYGAGATFTQIDATHWQVTYNGGASQEVITFANGASIHASDYAFVGGTQSLTTLDENMSVMKIGADGDESWAADDADVGTASHQSAGSAIEDQLATVSIASLLEDDMSDSATADVATPEPEAPVEPLGRPPLDGVHAEASAAVDTLRGTDGDDVFVFRAGSADGDMVLDFQGAAAGGADRIEFVGYGADAIFTQVDETHWLVSSEAAAQHEVISFEPALAINTQDFSFV